VAERGDIGPLAVELMDQIEAEHPGATIGEVGIVVEIHDPHTDETTIVARSTERRAWVAVALFDRAVHAINRLIP
jgi:hypothetical protein